MDILNQFGKGFCDINAIKINNIISLYQNIIDPLNKNKASENISILHHLGK